MSPFTRTGRALPAALALLVAPLASTAFPVPVTVTGIRCWSGAEYTRVAIDLSGEARYQAGTLPADPANGKPPRIFIDIDGAEAAGQILRRPTPVENGLLKSVRAGQFRKRTVRVVVDLERESDFRALALSNPDRIIIDVEDRSPKPAPAPPSPGRRIRVMLDPGHGGKDPGAIGPAGLMEKDVVLALGRMVRERLEREGGYEVLMTRDGDVFVDLEERPMMANRAGARLFVSLHINASRDRAAEGISTYVLNHTNDREALEVAARENNVPVRKLTPVKFILTDLSTVPRKNESLKLAKTVNDAIVRNVRRRHGRVVDLGLKQAPFYVLMGTRMTAILVEASFISNRHEEARLRDPAYLETLALSIVEAVRFYGEKGILAARPGL